MKVVLLCAGSGRRMFPLTEDKFLLKFVGKTLLEHQIELAMAAGLNEFIIIVNRKNSAQVTNIVAGISGIKARLVTQGNLPGIAGALQSAAELLDDAIIVVNPNDVVEPSAYHSLIESYRANTATASLLGYEVAEYFPGGYLVTGPEGYLSDIIEKPPQGKQPSQLVSILLHLHREPQRLLQYMSGTQSDQDDIYEHALGIMAQDTGKVVVVPYHGLWHAIKYPWHISRVVRYFLEQSPKHIAPSASISDKAIITGQVTIDDNASVLENAVIKGPVYIGPNSVIGNNCLIRDYSHIGADCVIGYATEIKNSYIGERCQFHMSYAGDAVIGDDCSFGAGTVLANYRFDEQNISITIDGAPVDTGQNKLGAIIGNNCRTGVNASIMPGIRIGPNAIVGAQVCLTEDLPPDTLIKAKPVNKTYQNRLKATGKKAARCAG